MVGCELNSDGDDGAFFVGSSDDAGVVDASSFVGPGASGIEGVATDSASVISCSVLALNKL